METTTLGRTGLNVSVAGLGCGGASRLGQAQGKSLSHSVDLVRTALDLGITLIDTAPAYGTEAIVGEALNGRRDKVVISTKTTILKEAPQSSPILWQRMRRASSYLLSSYIRGRDLRKNLEDSLHRLRSDYIDIYHLHGVAPRQYAYCEAELLPELEDLKQEGKIRFIGITEFFNRDTRHLMLAKALDTDDWDVVMVGHNILNPGARAVILPKTRARGVGTLIMFAVRRALSDQKALRQAVRTLAEKKEIPHDQIDPDNPLGFVIESGAAGSLIEAAYRFCRHEPGAHVILTGTGDAAHLKSNVAAINGPPLPDDILMRLRRLFVDARSISGN